MSNIRVSTPTHFPNITQPNQAPAKSQPVSPQTDAAPALSAPAENQTQTYSESEMNPQSLTFPTNAEQSSSETSPVKAPDKQLQNRFQEIANNNPDNLKSLLQQIYGEKASEAQIDNLVSQARDGKLPMPELRFVDPAQLEGHHGAYSEGIMYLSEDLKQDPGLLNLVVESEYGHHLDHILGEGDTEGDEGQMLALGLSQGGSPLSAEDLASTRQLADHKILEIDGKSVEVETIPPAVIAGAWWAAKVTAQTAVDTAIDFSIAAVLGVPPPGKGATAINALTNAIPGLGSWRTSRKLQKLSRAIQSTRKNLASIAKIPGGQQIQARFNRAAKDLQHALRQGKPGVVKNKLKDLMSAIKDAHALKSGGSVVSKISRSDFYKNIVRMNPAERVAQIKTRARDFANAKGWKIDNRLSNKNNRDIYHDPQTNRYYAVDSQHGDFEILNRRGRHQGSMDLWGDKTSNRHNHIDTSGGHDIIL